VQQNKAIRILGNCERGSASTVSIYKKFDILDVGKIRHPDWYFSISVST